MMGGDLALTRVTKPLGACRGSSLPRKTRCKLIVANEDNFGGEYALAA